MRIKHVHDRINIGISYSYFPGLYLHNTFSIFLKKIIHYLLNISPESLQDGLCLFFFFVFSRAAPTAYGGSQAGGQIGAVAASLWQSHSNAGTKLHLQPTPQLTATLDP